MAQINKKRKFVADGVFYSELNEFLTRELAKDGYSGVEVRTTPVRKEIVIRATNPRDVVGENSRRIRELTSLIEKRFGFPQESVEVYVDRVIKRGLDASSQAESLRFKLLDGIAVRRAALMVMRSAEMDGAKGCEVIVAGKLRGQRAKAMKFRQGYMIKTGQAALEYVDVAKRHVLMRQGVLGVKVKIMKPQDPQGIDGPSQNLPDIVNVIEPKPEDAPNKPGKAFKTRPVVAEE